MTRSRSIQKTLPRGVHLRPYYDQSTIVTESIKSVRDAILIGLVLASIIMVLFLRDWGTSLVAGLVIPITLLVTFIALKALGESFNLMTLGGLAAAVGLVIDDAIVVVENIVLHRDAGEGRMEAIHAALNELIVPLRGLHHYACRGVSAPHFDYRRHRHILPRPCRDHVRLTFHLARIGARLDTQLGAVLCAQKTCMSRRLHRMRRGRTAELP